MLLANAKAFGAGTLLGGAVLGLAMFTYGYRWGAGELAELKSKLETREVITQVVTNTVKEIVYQDRVEYRDRVKVVSEKVPFIVEREVYKNMCLDDDGLKAFNTFMGQR